MSRRFAIKRGATRVVFGAGAKKDLAAEVEKLGVSRALFVSTSGRRGAADELAAMLGARSLGVLSIAKEHVPSESVTEGCAETARVNADALVAVGGGSAIGLAKAIAVEGGRSVRVVCVPTTFSGSEMSPVYGVSKSGEKTVGRDERARPSLVVYDPELLGSLPRDVTLYSLWNALAHAVEALWAKNADGATLAEAEQAAQMLASAISWLGRDLGDRQAREIGLCGAFLAGALFGDVGGALHHKLCHVLGGQLGLPHAATHAVMLRHVVAFNRDSAPIAMSALARALGAADPVRALADLAEGTAPPSLSAIGAPRDLTKVIDTVIAASGSNFFPRPVDRESLAALLSAAMDAPAGKDANAKLRAPDTITTQPGFGGTHESEALPGALPHRQNTPRPSPYGTIPECLNGTPFTVKNADNSRVWMYRVRPTFSEATFRTLAPGDFLCDLGDVEPNRTRFNPLPIPAAGARVDFVDGLHTLGGAGDQAMGPGYLIHLYAANADMIDRCFSSVDGDLLIVPQEGTLDVRTELGWLRVPQGSILVIPRGIRFAVGLPDGRARGWMCEVLGPRFRLPERGPIGSNGLADARHFRAPVASYEDRECPNGFDVFQKLGGKLHVCSQKHSAFDVVAWHGVHVPYVYDLSNFSAMGSVTFDHPDPSILTVITTPLDDKGRAVIDFVAFPGRWNVIEHSFRPPYMHRNAASEVNGVIRSGSPKSDYKDGATFISPLLTPHGISTRGYDHELGQSDADHEKPERIPDESLWIMFESAMPFRTSTWARSTPLVDKDFMTAFAGMKKRFDPTKR